jgi:hypothetical protein
MPYVVRYGNGLQVGRAHGGGWFILHKKAVLTAVVSVVAVCAFLVVSLGLPTDTGNVFTVDEIGQDYALTLTFHGVEDSRVAKSDNYTSRCTLRGTPFGSTLRLILVNLLAWSTARRTHWRSRRFVKVALRWRRILRCT